MSGPFHVPWALLTHQPLAEPHSAVDVVGAGPELPGAIRSQRGAAPAQTQVREAEPCTGIWWQRKQHEELVISKHPLKSTMI